MGLVLLLPLLLVLGQQGALVHELGHFVQRVEQSSAPESPAHAGDYCDKCFVFAHLSGAAPVAAAVARYADPVADCVAVPKANWRTVEVPACRNRGPPARL